MHHQMYTHTFSYSNTALAADSCPSFGTEFDRGHDTSNRGLWLNFDTPSQCTGTAVEWRFCYYYQTGDDTLQARLRVYRKNGVTDSFEVVVDKDIDRRYRNDGEVPSSCDRSNHYCCENMMISAEIEKNDIIGVCMRFSDSWKPLYVLDEEPPSGYSLYKYPSSDRCQENEFDTFTESDLSSSPESFGLHAILITTGKIMSG